MMIYQDEDGSICPWIACNSLLAILSLVLSASLILSGWIELKRLSSRDLLHPPPSPRLTFKLVLVAFALLLQLVITVRVDAVVDQLEFISSLSLFWALLTAFPLHYFSHTRARRSSSELLFFYLFLLILSLPQPPFNLIPSNSNSALFIPLALRFATVLILFLAEYIGPPRTASGPIRLPTTDTDVPVFDDEECPIVYANIFSRLTFGWITPLMRLGKKQVLTEADLWRLPRADHAEALSDRLRKYWLAQLASPKPSLIIAVVRAYGVPYLTAALFKLAQDVIQFSQPQLLRRLLTFVESYRSGATAEPATTGYLIAILMFGLGLLQTFLLHQYFQRVFVTGMRIRSGLIGIIYSKALVLASSARGGRATGDIVNLMGTDVSKIQDCCSNGLVVLSGSFQLILAFLSLYEMLGWPMFGGIAVILISMPLNTLLVRIQTRIQKQIMVNKDRRTKLMSEILNNIRSIKLYTWESAFAKKMFEIRNERELRLLQKTGYMISASTTLWSFIPFLVAFAAFSLFALTSSVPLTPSLVFPAISLFQLLQFPLAVLPMVINQWVQAYVSIGRLWEFLTSPELQSESIIRKPASVDSPAIIVDAADFAWAPSSPEATLTHISLSVPRGALVAVVGRVGSGKSSLLCGLLGEMDKRAGRVELSGSIAYAAQSPWLLSATVRENILFGARYDEIAYKRVIEACALVDDLAMLSDGDETEVGERGISLSGGQKARLALARAVYARADIYFLDDVLSAVDAHVARHLFEHIIGPNGLLAGKARVLCTNAIPFCESADELILLREGQIVERGSFEAVLEHDGELRKLIEEFGKRMAAEEGETTSSSESSTTIGGGSGSSGSGSSGQQAEKDGFMRRVSIVPAAERRREALAALRNGTSSSSKKVREFQATGSVKTTVYRQYMQSCGTFAFSIYIFTIALQPVFQTATSFWLKYWSTTNVIRGEMRDVGFYLGIYALLGFLTSCVALGNGILLYAFCVIRSARKMHDGMFSAVIRASMAFFDTTPVGTILNRFSRDIFVIDEVLARVMGGFFRTVAGVVSVISVISFLLPPFLLVCVPLLWIYKQIQSYYLATSRELKRIDAVTKSPIYAMFGETLNGLVTIRAFGHQNRFVSENESRLDRNQEAYFGSIVANRWLAVRLELIGNLLIVSAAGLAVGGVVGGATLDSGLVGLLMSQALAITQSLNWLVRSATEVETNIVSCERVIEYMGIAPEGLNDKNTNLEPEPDWPTKGEVCFEGVQARYRPELDLVLKSVDFTAKPGEKVGICGRTGAGKSTITLSLFRLIELAGGRITVDGVDISTLSLTGLRSRMSIIPQDSQCFEGTLRENLDPSGIIPDDKLWEVLGSARLKAHVQTMDGGLDARIDEGGTNLSQGQRQLMCLARAMVGKGTGGRMAKVVVMDEATSAVDGKTDEEVQSVIRECFGESTVIVIAHRINTIMDCDRVIVLGEGKVIENGNPNELLKKSKKNREEGGTGGAFYGLCCQAGIKI
ncbi:hypothetical protein CROQUDRAFT_55936 [Cronartium quercuum f. sp. fusiforme G11]|uniref:Uncharacterized protein n=1 Tax=Cronartium quercuum f. sp. fusiforme G11 TaxID=708437 RepID=A0A9P6NY95_9BASI|nr:hypothetical protein CROQUDRAFT_55936 [Cronartium quercuum f. sp. fusiforme G11]